VNADVNGTGVATSEDVLARLTETTDSGEEQPPVEDTAGETPADPEAQATGDIASTAGVQVDLGGGNEVLLIGVAEADLTASDFVVV
jgi:hypothetical protein